jgi:cation diffusion facilitator family transporter
MPNSDQRSAAARSITLAGSVANFTLLIIKLAAGILANSRAMVADAVHTVTDFATDIIVFAGIRLGNKAEDEDHPWGHGKYENLAAWLISLSLIGVALGIAWDGITVVIASIRSGVLPPRPGIPAVIAAIVSLAAKEILYRRTIAVGKRIGNPAVIANAWHHRSDALSSAGTAVGIGAATFLGDFWTILDPLAALVVSGLILRAGISILRDSLDAFMEKGLEPELTERVRNTLEGHPQLSDIHHLRCRRVGSRMVMEVHVRMDGSMSLSAAHEVTAEVERELRSEFGEDLISTIHMEPMQTGASLPR